jgi:hypothetical protein
MIDTYATAGAFRSVHQFAVDAAAVVLGLERVPNIALLRKNTAADDATVPDRTWVILTEAIAEGWGLNQRAHSNDELVSAARAELAKLKT